MSKELELIAEHRWSERRAGCTCGWQPNYSNTHKAGVILHAEHQLSKLSEHGYSIVEVRRPQPDYDGNRYFDGVSYKINERGVLLKNFLVDGVWGYAIASPARVRAHALELLAAAAAAEEDQ